MVPLKGLGLCPTDGASSTLQSVEDNKRWVALCREEGLVVGQEQAFSGQRVRETFRGEGVLEWELSGKMGFGWTLRRGHSSGRNGPSQKAESG